MMYPKYIFFIANLLFASLLTACIFSSDPECENDPGELGRYYFRIPVSISPAQDTLRIGDTLSIAVQFGPDIYEGMTAKSYDLSHVGFNASFLMARMDNENYENGGIDLNSLGHFTIPVLNTDKYGYELMYSSDGTSSIIGDIPIINGQNEVKLELIMQKTGVFMLTQFIDEENKDHNIEFDGRCPQVWSNFVMEVNGNQNSNEYLLYESPAEHFNTWIPEKINTRFYDMGRYCFVVVE